MRDAIILACFSSNYFTPHLKPTLARPLMWTTGLMCPDAYTLHNALSSYIRNESAETVKSNAAKAYAIDVAVTKNTKQPETLHSNTPIKK